MTHCSWLGGKGVNPVNPSIAGVPSAIQGAVMEKFNRDCPSCGAAEGVVHKSDCDYRVDYKVDPINLFQQGGRIKIPLPPEVMPYQHEIRRFVEAMVYKLAVHSDKGKWEDLAAEKALGFLATEVKELQEALDRGNMVEILLEAADVGNYALILSAIVMERGK